MQELTHYIGGQHVKGTSGRFADVFNPATGEVQAKVPLASAAELAQAVDTVKDGPFRLNSMDTWLAAALFISFGTTKGWTRFLPSS